MGFESIDVGGGLEIIIDRDNGLKIGAKIGSSYVTFINNQEYHLEKNMKIIHKNGDLILEANNRRYSLIK